MIDKQQEADNKFWRISLSQVWDPLLAFQCRVVSPETIYTPSTKPDSESCIYAYFSHICIFIYLYNNNKQRKRGYLLDWGTGEIGRKVIRRVGRKKKEERKWCNLISAKVKLKTKHMQDYFEDCRKSFYFACLFFRSKSRGFITGYCSYYRILRAFWVLTTVFCSQWVDIGKSWGRRSWYPYYILWEGKLIVRIYH